jgi:hypothetical protein
MQVVVVVEQGLLMEQMSVQVELVVVELVAVTQAVAIQQQLYQLQDQ